MEKKYTRKFAMGMLITCAVVGLTSLAVCVMGIAMKEYIIGGAMAIVTAGQAYNFFIWKKRLN